MGRRVPPKENVDPVLFLASECGSFITGQTLYVDGRYSAGKMGVMGPMVLWVPPTLPKAHR